jgi:hypothetical protein
VADSLSDVQRCMPTGLSRVVELTLERNVQKTNIRWHVTFRQSRLDAHSDPNNAVSTSTFASTLPGITVLPTTKSWWKR